MGHKRVLYLKRTDTIARTLDDIIGASHEPEVAILVTPRHIARVIYAIMPHLAGAFLVMIVAFEEADSLVVDRVDADFATLSVLTVGAVRTQKAYLILRIGLSHASRARLNPWESAQRHGGFGLSEAFHDVYSSEFKELRFDGRIHRFARRRAVFQTAEVVLAEVFQYHKAVNRRGRTEGCNVISFHSAHDFLCRELLMVKYKHRRSGEPLSV